jgi:2-polyprenyl-3-methyl-5-hydroxy-6-metoxy-1,4-benzoquinol methylase
MSSQLHSSQDDWNAHWDLYAESARLNPAQRMRHELIAQLLCETASNSTPRIFDLGSGQGDLFKKLQALLPKAAFLGVEMSERGVAISRSKVPQATFVVADIFQPPPALDDFAGWATDAVCSEVLEHVDDPSSFLKHARHYLAPGARMIVTVPGGPTSAFDRHIGHRQHFDRRKIRAVLEQAGYAVERIYLTGFPFFNLYRLLVIARGKQLAQDAETKSVRTSSGLARWAMKSFELLFRLNLRDSPFGWQIVALARKTSP